MSVSNGQLANQTTFNNAFLSRTTDTSATGKVDLLNVAAESGDSITNVQRELNSEASYTGKSVNTNEDDLPTWTNNDVGTPTDNLTERADALTAEFDPSTGHDHDGLNSAPIDALDLASVRLRGYMIRGTNLTAVTGSTVDVSVQMASKTPSTSDTTKGVVVSPSNNRIIIRDHTVATQGDELKSALGDLVYGRLTYAASVWTLSFFTDIASVETAYALTAQDTQWYYQELFNPITDAPIYNELTVLPSDNATQDVVDASYTQRGLVSTGNQAFAGVKTYDNVIETVSNKNQGFQSFERLDVAGAASITALANTKSFVKLTGVTATTIHGITAGVNGQIITIHNGTTAITTIKHESVTASAPDRLVLPDATDLEIDINSSAAFIYDTGQSRWVIYSGAGAGSGGAGGMPVEWNESALTPVFSYENDLGVYLFDASLLQRLWAVIKVPAEYTPGKQIKFYTAWYSPDSSGTIGLSITAYLVRAGVDTLATVTNSQTDSATAVLGAGTVNEPQSASIDLTDAVGAINSVAVSPGDFIRFQLSRTDSVAATNELRLLKAACASEVTFNG